MLTPIAVFAFNRPNHLRRTLTSLSCNPEAEGSRLIVFSDGPRIKQDEELVAEVRDVARERGWCGTVEVVASAGNKGLARSVIDGVTATCERYGRVIVLEDDLAVSSTFLSYVNQALDRYEQDPRIMQISAHCFPAAGFENSGGASFLPVSTTLGWGTWKRAWDRFDVGTRGIGVLLRDKHLRARFDLGNAYPYYRLFRRVTLHGQAARSWGIHWYWTVFSCEGLVLYPHRTLVQHFGDDGSGTNVRGRLKPVDILFSPHNEVTHWPSEVSIDGRLYEALRRYHIGQRSLVRSLSRLVRRFTARVTG